MLFRSLINAIIKILYKDRRRIPGGLLLKRRRNSLHIKDISIKTRLIISNILMLIIPCSLVVIITAVIFTGFVYRFDGTDVRTQLTDSLGFISVYQLQFHVNQLEKEVLQTGENVSEQEEIVSMCKELEDTGALVAILFDNVPAYSTPGYTLEEWETEVE